MQFYRATGFYRDSKLAGARERDTVLELGRALDERMAHYAQGHSREVASPCRRFAGLRLKLAEFVPGTS